MLSRLRLSGMLSPAFALRKISAALLALCLLTTIAPSGISSPAHECSMPCCASGSCATGACDFSFASPAKKSEPESHCTDGEQHASHQGHEAMEHAPATENADELCGAENLTKRSGPRPLKTETVHKNSVKPQSFSRPCSPDCGAGAVSQVRRTSELAILGHAHRPRPPTRALNFKNASNLIFLNPRRHRLSPPRAPPAS